MANLAALLTFTQLFCQVNAPPDGPTYPIPPATRLVAEFEHQAAIVLAWSFDEEQIRIAQAKMIRELLPTVDVAVLVLAGAEETARHEMTGLQVPLNRIRLVSSDYDTMWIRDYGPVVRSTLSGPELLDFRYCETRPLDETIPRQISALTRTRLVDINLAIDGGNFLTNGRGLVLATQSIYFDNQSCWRSVEEAERILAEKLAVDQVVLLEQLLGEPTSHVDMFATFTDERTLVLGEYDTRDESENAAILNRNARRLSRIQTPSGPLRILRIPMPPPINDTWYSFANVVYANGTLLLPRYASVSRRHDQRALATYRHALPNWKIIRVDADELIERAGALHCATLNVPHIRGLSWETLLPPNRPVHAHLKWNPAGPVPRRATAIPTELDPFRKPFPPESTPSSIRRLSPSIPTRSKLRSGQR